MNDTTPKFEVFKLDDTVYRLNRITGETWRLEAGKWAKVNE
jgi:hypothetical protein